MQQPLEITYRGLERNDYTDGLIHKKADKLQRACANLVSCRVVLEKEQKQQRTGNEHRIRVSVRVPPGQELVVNRKTLVMDTRRDLPPLVRDAFEAAERQIKDLVSQKKGRGKHHPKQHKEAFVDRLFPQESSGIIRTVDGQEIRFGSENLDGVAFDALEVGAGVAFELAEDGQALQASSVRLMRR